MLSTPCVLFYLSLKSSNSN
ncbi:hypothetical protein Zm00014a_033987 [Zea mays]|uniref:Uncharacterized protein n=1 Tax=Zea mays TaxID=4577 RepID=A0A3L6G6Z0_MAIZE|nr:hypothetical protein Zm00014a_033987 [Zea mays]